MAVYNLCNKQENSEQYYQNIETVTQVVKQKILTSLKEEIASYQHYIGTMQLEKERTQIEYGLELLMLGVFWQTYGQVATKLGRFQGRLLEQVAVVRKRSKKMKPFWSKLKGRLSAKYLVINSSSQVEYCTIEQLLHWMKATGEYDEEVIRFRQWEGFLKKQHTIRQDVFKKKVILLAQWFNQKVEKELSPYIVGVEFFQRQRAEGYRNREDRIFCMQPSMMYYLNMVGAQMLNEVYHKAFLKASKKVIFLPGCMPYQGKNQCKAILNQGAYLCQDCTVKCQVHQIKQLATKYHAQTMVLYHESELNKQKVKEQEGTVGVIGIACVLSLLSGGLKAKRLGYVPQCVLLDYCGCKQHWEDEEIVTRIHLQQLKRILADT